MDRKKTRGWVGINIIAIKLEQLHVRGVVAGHLFSQLDEARSCVRVLIQVFFIFSFFKSYSVV